VLAHLHRLAIQVAVVVAGLELLALLEQQLLRGLAV
jgi:hypothetical protein